MVRRDGWHLPEGAEWRGWSRIGFTNQGSSVELGWPSAGGERQRTRKLDSGTLPPPPLLARRHFRRCPVVRAGQKRIDHSSVTRPGKLPPVFGGIITSVEFKHITHPLPAEIGGF